MRIYYNDEFDILCIVEGGVIWKFVGELCESKMFAATAPEFNEWYEAYVHPEHSIANFELIGHY